MHLFVSGVYFHAIFNNKKFEEANIDNVIYGDMVLNVMKINHR
jgi:hypothetical protein